MKKIRDEKMNLGTVRGPAREPDIAEWGVEKQKFTRRRGLYHDTRLRARTALYLRLLYHAE